MGAGNYSGTKAEIDDYRRLLAVERKHIEVEPSGEREEIRQIFAGKGFDGPELERIVDVITADKERWAKTMAVEEYGLSPALKSPIRAALEYLGGVRAERAGAADQLFGRLQSDGVRSGHGIGVLRNWRGEKPLVARRVASIRYGNAGDRHERSRIVVLDWIRAADAGTWGGMRALFHCEIAHPLLSRLNDSNAGVPAAWATARNHPSPAPYPSGSATGGLAGVSSSRPAVLTRVRRHPAAVNPPFRMVCIVLQYVI